MQFFIKAVAICGIGTALFGTQDINHNKAFEAFLVKQKQHLLQKHPTKKDTIEDIFQDAKLVEKVIKRDKNQLHKKVPFSKYVKWVVSDKRIQRGHEQFKTYGDTIKPIAKRYQVDPEVMTALWGIETFYGKIQGNYTIADAFLTLIYDGRRAKFFGKELDHIINIMHTQKLSKHHVKGSWAGAMGAIQFMPSSYTHYAVDGDGDGKKDIWGNDQDIFASIANYLKRHGFGYQKPIALEIKPADHLKPHLNTTKTFAQWQKLPVVVVSDFKHNLQHNLKASLITYSSRYFLTFDNFKVIKRWNRSDFFALSVALLSMELSNPKPKDK